MSDGVQMAELAVVDAAVRWDEGSDAKEAEEQALERLSRAVARLRNRRARRLRAMAREVAANDVPGGPALREPPEGWAVAFQRLMAARCPYCVGKVAYLSTNGDKLTWSCGQGCNP